VFLDGFVADGGTVEFSVGWFSEGLNTGAEFDFKLRERLSALHISLVLDVYG
jgi:hypothetical protein